MSVSAEPLGALLRVDMRRAHFTVGLLPPALRLAETREERLHRGHGQGRWHGQGQGRRDARDQANGGVQGSFASDWSLRPIRIEGLRGDAASSPRLVAVL
jgi:hypothetical protein